MDLSDRDIKEEIKNGNIIIEPLNERNIQPASVDLILGNGFLNLDYHNKEGGIIRLSEQPIYQSREGKIIVPAQGFVLGTTLEYVTLSSNITANVQGKSSIGRLGLFVQNAGYIDPGFEGNITLELFNANSLPIELEPGVRICQISFGYTQTPAEHPYNGKYKGQRGVTGSRSFLDPKIN
jgi:dCTP deaminase